MGHRSSGLSRRRTVSVAAVMAAVLVAVFGATSCRGSSPHGEPSAAASAAPSSAGCIASGTDADINAALRGPGAVVELCAGAVFALHQPVTFTADNQQLRTRGRPTDDTRALLRVDSPTLTSAVNGVDRSAIVVESIRVDGARPALGPLPGDALIEIGGKASGQTVRHISAGDTRSWSTIHITEGGAVNGEPICRKATIADNTLGPAGTPDGNWADGISLACGESLVQHNVIRDATDGAIVIFGAAGSTVDGNTIVAATRTLLGGINMVDYDVDQGNYRGTKVTANVISSEGALVKVGIGMGPQVWFCQPGVNVGATVTGNTVKGDTVGYSFPVNGVRDWTVSGNVDLAHHSGLPAPGCGGMPSPPGGFQFQAVTSSHLQAGYTSASLTYLLGVYEPGTPPTGCAVMYAEQPLVAGHSVRSCDGRFALAVQASGSVVLLAGATVLWSAPLGGAKAAKLVVHTNGNVVAVDAAGHTVWATGTGGHPGARLAVQDDGNLVLYDPANKPLWSTNTSA